MGLSRVRLGPLACDLLTDSSCSATPGLSPHSTRTIFRLLPGLAGRDSSLRSKTSLTRSTSRTWRPPGTGRDRDHHANALAEPRLDDFQLGHISFGNTTIHIPPGRNAYSTQIDDRANSGLFVDVSAGIDYAAGVVTWTSPRSIPRPWTVRPIPSPASSRPIRPRRGGGFGVVHNLPQVVARQRCSRDRQGYCCLRRNAPIDTNSVTNTIDAGPPQSHVNPLPPTLTIPNITLSWTGSDGAGPGIAGYDVFVSDNGGPFTAFSPARPRRQPTSPAALAIPIGSTAWQPTTSGSGSRLQPPRLRPPSSSSPRRLWSR